MISQQYLNSILFIVAALCVLGHSSPVLNEGHPSAREGRFYGMAGSQASAMASAGAGGGGFGYPGYGLGSANSFASASANAGAGSLLGYGIYGK